MSNPEQIPPNPPYIPDISEIDFRSYLQHSQEIQALRQAENQLIIPKFQTQVTNDINQYMNKFIKEFENPHSRFIEEEESFERPIQLEKKEQFALRPSLMVKGMSRIFMDEEKLKTNKYEVEFRDISFEAKEVNFIVGVEEGQIPLEQINSDFSNEQDEQK